MSQCLREVIKETVSLAVLLQKMESFVVLATFINAGLKIGSTLISQTIYTIIFPVEFVQTTFARLRSSS